MGQVVAKGRPRHKIDWEDFDKLCELHCTLIEIAGWFDCSIDTIEAATLRDKGMHFSDYFKIRSAPGKISLRRKQFEKAMTGSVPMLIWLGKQYLGQKDNHTIDEAVKDGKLIIKLDNPDEEPEQQDECL